MGAIGSSSRAGGGGASGCLATLRFALDSFGRGAGKKGGSASYRDLARRVGFFANLRSGIFRRKNVPTHILEHFADLVKNGTYDGNIDGIINSCDEDVGESLDVDMGKYLMEVSALV